MRIEKITRQYAKIEMIKAKWNPTATPSTVANTEPKTEDIPFIPQTTGIRIFSVFSNLKPEGKGIPMKNPNGKIETKVKKILCSRGRGSKYFIIWLSDSK